MNAVVCLLLYGAVLTWLCPALLTRLTRSGLNPRLAVVVWLVAVATALGAWAVAGVGLVLDVAVLDAATAGPAAAPVEYCLEVVATLGRAGLSGRVAVAVAGAVVLALSVVIVRRIILTLKQFWARSSGHAADARIVGSSTRRRDVVVVAADRPAAYCVAGRPHAIVVTTGALARLEEAELLAVLAHERAHLSGRHLQLMMLLRALAAAMPRLPLFRDAVESVGRLIEMCADDVAARRHGRRALLGGLITLAGQPRLTDNALGAADTAAFARAVRLAGPARRGARWRQRILLGTTLAALVIAPFAVAAICHA